MDPTIGRIVHYVGNDFRTRAAIVVDVSSELANLHVFKASPSDLPAEGEDVMAVVHSEHPQPGTWHWPPLVQHERPRIEPEKEKP